MEHGRRHPGVGRQPGGCLLHAPCRSRRPLASLLFLFSLLSFLTMAALPSLGAPGSLTRHLTPETAALRAQLKGLLPAWAEEEPAPAPATAEAAVAAEQPASEAPLASTPHAPPEPSAAVAGMRDLLTKVSQEGVGVEGGLGGRAAVSGGRACWRDARRRPRHTDRARNAKRRRPGGTSFSFFVRGAKPCPPPGRTTTRDRWLKSQPTAWDGRERSRRHQEGAGARTRAGTPMGRRGGAGDTRPHPPA